MSRDPHLRNAALEAQVRDLEGQLQVAAREEAILRQQLADQNASANPELVAFAREIAESQSKYSKRAKELVGD